MKKIIYAALFLFQGSLMAQTVSLVSPLSSWKYLANGSNQGTAWRASTFNDASWLAGNAQLGYGDGDEATVVSFGPSSSAKYITTYFRKSINITNAAALSSILLKVRRDDGIVVYVNGIQRYKNNMPTTVSYTTKASTDASDDGNTWLSTTSLLASHFVNGTNVIAVEIHQRSASSSDISFDLELTATQSGPDVTSPTVLTLNPSDNAANVTATSNLTMTFNETVQKGTGSISIKEGGIVTQTIAVSDASVTVSGATVTINPADFTFSSAVNVEMPAGTFKDLANNNYAGITTATAWNFAVEAAPSVCNTIGCFTSVQPTAQTTKLVLPSTHHFQMLSKQGNAYTVGGGSVPGGQDFTGYVPISGSSTNGYLHVNHENSPGGVSNYSINYNSTTKLWNVASSQAISFAASSIVKTERNCSGGVTPWGTTITSEETRNTGDANGDGYIDCGWHVEIDPVTKQVKQYGNGIQEKLWAMGRMSHENIVVSSNQTTAYYGEDSPDGCVYKFVANTAGNLSAGTLYVLKLTTALSGGEPTSTTGTWLVVPNTTQSDRNNTYSLAIGLGATQFNGVEDVEIAPNGQIYFTSKGNGKVYRFTDATTTVSNFITFVGGTSYTINYGTASASESWGTGNDNLAFDGEGNLWVNQDGGRGHLWLVRPNHTQASPKVELFATTPSGSESTGLTFSPDFKYMFLSIQHPSTSNVAQIDASGANVSFNAPATIVIARNENLGTNPQARSMQIASTENTEMIPAALVSSVSLFPNPNKGQVNLAFSIEEESTIEAVLYSVSGTELMKVLNTTYDKGQHEFKLDSTLSTGTYLMKVNINGSVNVIRFSVN